MLTGTSLRVVGHAVGDAEEQPSFDAFWLIYPKRVAKFEASTAWARLSASDQLAAIIGLVAWRQVWMRRGDLQFVPHAATWLNNHRWEDELPDQWVATGHASHAAAALPAKGERAVMPENVKALLAKLRVKH